jgi:sugar phosphate isomerase/epimerase
MIITAVTNEVHPSAEAGSITTVLERAVSAGIHNFELRLVEGRRAPVLDGDAWRRLRSDSERLGVSFSAISPGLFMPELNSELIPLHRNHLLPMTFEMAEHIGAEAVIVFAPKRSAHDSEETFSEIVELFRIAVDMAVARGVTVQLENLPGSWADTSDNCLSLLDAVDRPDFGYVWDTGNLFEAEQEHFLVGYEKLKRYIRNVHLKDARFEDGKIVWKRYGEGVTDIRGQVETLKGDGFDGTVVLEAACKPHELEDFPVSARYLQSLI